MGLVGLLIVDEVLLVVLRFSGYILRHSASCMVSKQFVSIWLVGHDVGL